MLRSFLGYVVVVAFFTRHWLPEMVDSIPRSSNVYDAHLIAWVLAWITHALTTDPRHLFDANIYYPAPGQLTGWDHFFSSQLLFAPIFRITHNAIFSANLIVWASYPLAGLAMERLLRRLGLGAKVAWVAGLLFALGPMRVPLNMHLLQFLNVYLPLTAFALVQLRDEPTLPSAATLALVFAAGIFSSYYMAIMLGIVAAIWGLSELLREAPSRLRFVILALGAATVASACLLVFAHPYLMRNAREGAASLPEMPSALTFLEWVASLVRQRWLTPTAVPLFLVGASGVLALTSRDQPLRRIGATGLALVLIGTALMFGFPTALAPAIAASPLRFFRAAYRMSVVSGFGHALLVAAGLELIRRRLGWAAGTAAIGAVAVSLVPLAGRITDFRTYTVLAVTRASAYARVGQLVRAGGEGALLELPLTAPVATGGLAATYETDAMVGSTYHWLPLLDGYTGYEPPHRQALLDVVTELPEGPALDDLVDMTHVRWILLRPAADWPDADERDRFLRSLLAWPSAGPTWDIQDFTLFRLDRVPAHPEWFAALAGGAAGAHTALGTSIGPLPAPAAAATVAADLLPTELTAGQEIALRLSVHNAGSVAWPVAIPPTTALRPTWERPLLPRTYAVVLVSRWRPLDGPPGNVPQPQEIRLRRDVPPGETIVQPVALQTPESTGRYEFELAIEQIAGATFSGGGNRPLRASITLR